MLPVVPLCRIVVVIDHSVRPCNAARETERSAAAMEVRLARGRLAARQSPLQRQSPRKADAA
jgi:hypothetical protein